MDRGASKPGTGDPRGHGRLTLLWGCSGAHRVHVGLGVWHWVVAVATDLDDVPTDPFDTGDSALPGRVGCIARRAAGKTYGGLVAGPQVHAHLVRRGQAVAALRWLALEGTSSCVVPRIVGAQASGLHRRHDFGGRRHAGGLATSMLEAQQCRQDPRTPHVRKPTFRAGRRALPVRRWRLVLLSPTLLAEVVDAQHRLPHRPVRCPAGPLVTKHQPAAFNAARLRSGRAGAAPLHGVDVLGVVGAPTPPLSPSALTPRHVARGELIVRHRSQA